MNPNREYGFTFGILGVACAGLFSVYTQPWLVVLLVNISLFFVIAFGYARNRPGIFLKRHDGRFSPFSYLLFWPYHALNALSLLLIRLQPDR
jgi:FtsH-binding integral membrane protein